MEMHDCERRQFYYDVAALRSTYITHYGIAHKLLTTRRPWPTQGSYVTVYHIGFATTGHDHVSGERLLYSSIF